MKENYNQNDFIEIKEKAMFFKEFREKVGLTQRELAKCMSVQHATIAKYESGTNSPSSGFLKRYCETLDANPNFLLFGELPLRRSEIISESRNDPSVIELVKETLLVSDRKGINNKLKIALLLFLEENKG